jgi:omega-amidase
MVQEFRLALCQILTEEKKQDTLDKAERMIREAAESGARVVALPEMFACPYSHPFFRPFAETEDGPTVRRMAYWAKEYSIILIGGSIPELDGDRLYNTSFIFDEDGNRIAKHRKDHMFDISLSDGTYFRESDSFSRGNDICVFDTSCGRMGVAICFDVRFPELIRAMALQGAQLVVLPAQFTVSTGKAHWETTMRARAVDNEIFFAAVSAARNTQKGYRCWGHSLVAGPFGDIRAQADETEQILYTDVNLTDVQTVRQQLPTFLHLRKDLYRLPIDLEE